jgi:hypothetical protein
MLMAAGLLWLLPHYLGIQSQMSTRDDLPKGISGRRLMVLLPIFSECMNLLPTHLQHTFMASCLVLPKTISLYIFLCTFDSY